METLRSLLSRYKYAAMFGVLVLCGLGLPLPEEATLILSGLAVGWKEADFLLTSLACVAGILVGDSVIFALGRYWGRQFLASRPMRLVLSARRQVKVHRFFAKHGSKAVFFARFFAGVRIGVYAYAGQHGMPWLRFICLDFLGAIISGPTSIWLGKFAAERIADPEGARRFAESLMKRGWHWLYLASGVLVALVILHWLWYRRGDRRSSARSTPAAVPRPPSLVESPGPVDERPLSSA